MRNFKTFDVIGHFERPVLILHGAEDEIVPIGYSVKAVKKYPNARLEEFAHEPHGFQRMKSKNGGNAVVFCS
ncbi:MAG: alpha/beta fold hydrolase [Lachnospiraceae bacterium]